MEKLKLITASYNMCESLRLQGVAQNSIFHWYEGPDGKMVPGILKEVESHNVSAWTVAELAAGIGPIARPVPVAFMPTGVMQDRQRDGTFKDRPPYWQYYSISVCQPVANMADGYIRALLGAFKKQEITPEDFDSNIISFHNKYV